MDLLSMQPTKVPLLHEYKTMEELHDAQSSHLLFNTANTFLIGSPVPLFLYLQGVQLIARRGTARAISEDPSAARDSSDSHHFSPSTETLSNCRHISDPVSFAPMGASVENVYAKLLRSVTMEEASNALIQYRTVIPLSITKLFEKVEHPFALAGHIDVRDLGQEENKGTGRMLAPRVTGRRGSDLNQLIMETFRGKERFHAFSPLGNIDFTMGDPGLNEYLDMISAHTSYWTSQPFCKFVLSVLFSFGPQQQLAFVPNDA